MAVYNTTSAEAVIALLNRRIKLTDASFLDDIWNSLHGAISALKTRAYTRPSYKIVEVEDHICKLPCGVYALDAVYHNGYRIRKGTSVMDTRVTPFSRIKDSNLSVYFTDPSDPAYKGNQQDYLLLRGTDIKIGSSQVNATEFYQLFPNHIQTSFKSGEVLLLYRTTPVDDAGFPVVMDEHNYIQACFWFIMAELCLAGYKHNDPRMDYEYCDQRFERFARRAKNKMKYWSIDQREAVLQASVNLIPPQSFYSNFGINNEQPKFVDK